MKTDSSDKILFVDDDPCLLEAMKRQFRRQFSISLAEGPKEALELIRSEGPFAVVVSDQSMPGMDGVEFLGEVRQLSPDSVRILLTGHSNVQLAIDAINEGQIFRFLTKPCPREVLRVTLESGIDQYHLITSERVLLTQTLQGSVKVFMDLLALNSPDAFGRANRIKRIAKAIVGYMNASPAWQIELAASLSLIGCVTIPATIVRKALLGETLLADDQEIYLQHPIIGHDLIANIPRLEGVAEIVRYQENNFDGTGVFTDATQGLDIPLGARILKVASDYDLWLTRNVSHDGAMQRLRNCSHYDPEVILALEAQTVLQEASAENQHVRKVPLSELSPGMVVAKDIRTADNSVLLLRKGQEVSEVLLQRLRNFHRHSRVSDIVEITVPDEERVAVSVNH